MTECLSDSSEITYKSKDSDIGLEDQKAPPGDSKDSRKWIRGRGRGRGRGGYTRVRHDDCEGEDINTNRGRGHTRGRGNCHHRANQIRSSKNTDRKVDGEIW